MKHPKLRIAWSVVWGSVAVLLVALWVRSYACLDSVHARTHNVVSANGTVYFDCGITWAKSVRISRYLPFQSELTSSRSETAHATPTAAQVRVPHWTLVTCIAAIGATSLISYRFSLRTLLIATTFIAVGLGLIVWLS